MISVHFTIRHGNTVGLNDGNVDDRIPGARHEGRGHCVLKISNTAGAKLPELMLEHTTIERVQLTEKGQTTPFAVGRHRDGDTEVSVNPVTAGKRDVTIIGKSFADVLAAWEALKKGEITPKPVTFSR